MQKQDIFRAKIQTEYSAIPIYYHSKDKNKEYIIFSPSYMNYGYGNTTSGGIFQYDISDKIFMKITSYPKGFTPTNHAITINPNNGDLYILNGDEEVFGILNLESLEWTIKCRNPDDKNIVKYNILNLRSPLIQYTTTNNNKLHVIHHDACCNTIHYMFNKTINRFVKLHDLSKLHKYDLCDFKLLYIEFMNCLLLIGGRYLNGFKWYNSKLIYFYGLHKKQNGWSVFRNMLPDIYPPDAYTVVLAYDYLLFLFLFDITGKQTVWCLDLLLTHKWYKILTKTIYKRCSWNVDGVAFNGRNGTIYFVEGRQNISSISLVDMIPPEILPIYNEYYSQIIEMYTAQQMKDRNYTLPMDINNLILHYFPLFL